MAEHIFNDQNFDAEVLQSKDLVLVDFWAEWCGPCRILGPVIEELAGEYKGKGVKVGKLNVDENGETAAKFSVMSIPTVLFMRNGEVVDQSVGALPKEALKSKIDALLK